MPLQPTLNLSVFVWGVIVGDQMNLQIHGSRHVDQPQELQPLLVAMPWLATLPDAASIAANIDVIP